MTDHYATRRGEARPAAKMTEARVRRMRWRYEHEEPRPSIERLAADFGLSMSTTHAILTRRYWKHVP